MKSFSFLSVGSVAGVWYQLDDSHLEATGVAAHTATACLAQGSGLLLWGLSVAVWNSQGLGWQCKRNAHLHLGKKGENGSGEVKCLQSHPEEPSCGNSKYEAERPWRKNKRLTCSVFNFICTLNWCYSKWSFAHVFISKNIFCFFNRAKRMFPRYSTTSWEDKLAHAALQWNTLVPIHISYSCF